MVGSTLKRGLSPKAITLVGLVLAVAVLGPSAAVAKKGGTDRPIKDHSSGTTVLDLGTLAFVTDATGTTSHLGKTTTHLDGVVTPTGADTFTIAGSFVTVAANGDTLFGTFSGSGTIDAAGNSQGPVVTTYTGGTGRFEGASGSSAGSFSQVFISTDGATQTFATDYTLRGTISY
ncbi:MAG TPA: hypothetical protein VGP44_00405 [Gemmatimonadales bacterium]|nr:hypothetical protein [Gemmatimonadales bacterium]